MKVIHVETGMNLYGGALQVFYLLRGLHDHGVHNILVCPKGSEIARCAAPYAEIHELTCRGDLDFVFGHRLFRLVEELDPDLLHVHSRRGADLWGSLVVRRTGQPAVLTRRVDNPEPGWLARWKYRPFKHLITISEGIRRVLVGEGLPSGKISCVRSALDTSLYDQEPDPDWFRQEFDLPDRGLTVGVVAQLIERKGHRLLIEAIPAILQACPDTCFLFFGKGPERKALEDLCRKTGVLASVRFAGFRSDLPRILPNLTLLAHPAMMEGLGIALLQASASRLPVVAARAGGIPEAVRSGINGVLVEPGEIEGLAREVSRLLQDADLRSRLGEGGRQLVESEFSVSVMVEGNLAIYRTVADSDGEDD